MFFFFSYSNFTFLRFLTYPVNNLRKKYISFTNFLMHGYSNPLRKDSSAFFIPPYMAILSLSLAILTLALLIHLDNFRSSPPNSFLVPLTRHQVSITPKGLKELEGSEKDEDNSSYNLAYIKESNGTS